MRFHVLTLFPEMILQGLKPSIIGRAVEKNIITLEAVDIRDYTLEKHRKVDDYPYGGGAGMLMQAQPVYDAYQAVTGGRQVRTVYVTPQGEVFTQKKARELATEEELVFLCGHYEGIDERVLEEIVTDAVSIGDYVLTGGELPAMVMIDAIARLIPGVLGNEVSAEEESFHNDLLEYPQYSRPEIWHGKKVPQVLLSGNHSKVAAWRLEQSRMRTADRRPDLYARYQERQFLIKQLSGEKRNHIHMMESLARGRSEILCADQGAGNRNLLLYDRAAGLCMVSAADMDAGKHLAEQIPFDTEWVVASQPFLEELLAERHYRICCHSVLMLYTRKVMLPMNQKEIRQLFAEQLSDVMGILCEDGILPREGMQDYLRERILANALYGAFAEERLVGFGGTHRDGSLGLLYVKKSDRRQRFGSSLTAYVVNHMLEKGWTPYGYVSTENQEAALLLDGLGFYRATRSLLIAAHVNSIYFVPLQDWKGK